MIKSNEEVKGNLKACSHHTMLKLGYIQWQDYAKDNYDNGIEQSQCPVCKLWLFPEEMGNPQTINTK